MSNVSLKKKISAKTIIGNVLTLLARDADKKLIVDNVDVPLMRVAGIASKIKSGNSTYGEWTAYLGEFRAVNLQTGDVFMGSELFVPDVVQTLITPVVSQAEKNGTTVELAFDIGVKAAIGRDGRDSYEYTAKPLLEMSADASPAASLLERLGAAPVVPQLAAPAGVQTTTTEPTSESAPSAETKAKSKK